MIHIIMETTKRQVRAFPSVLSECLCEEFVISGGITYYQNVIIFEIVVLCVLPLM